MSNDNGIENDEEEFHDSESEPSIVESNSPPSDQAMCSTSRGSIGGGTDQQTPFSGRLIYAVQFLNKQHKATSEQDLASAANKSQTGESAAPSRIFINYVNAMKLCKQDPDNRRFKAFKSFQEAYAFSYGAQAATDASMEQVKASIQSQQIDSPSGNQPVKANNVNDVEKLPFAAPREPEINELRSFIERKNFEAFRDKVVANPRFLISSGDAPIIVQKSFRYNCIHVCAKENNFQACQLVINLLSNSSYISKLYRNDTPDQAKRRCSHILDLYLNSPEKGLNETPLHFATKFGSYEVARLLMSNDICQKMALNKFGKTPKDVICTKVSNNEKYELINALFEKCYFVPIYRDDDKGDVLIDKPSPKLATTLDAQNNLIDNLNRASNFATASPSKYSQKKLAGYVGPVSPSVAKEFYEKIKSPVCLRKSPANIDILRGDEFKGYERIFRKITDEMSLPWHEYWSFLDSYCNLKSPEGFELLEAYLEQKKFQNTLDTQLKSAQIILNDQLNNNDENKIKNDDTKYQLSLKLDYFVRLVGDVRELLELKENQLSHKYLQFVRLNLDTNADTVELLAKRSQTNNNDEHTSLADAPEGLTSNDYKIYEKLTHFMSVIIEVSRLDSTSKCYFNLYKTSKDLLRLLRCEKLFDSFYLSPTFKRITKQLNVRPPGQAPLSNKTNQNPFELRRMIKYDDSDDEDDATRDKKSENVKQQTQSGADQSDEENENVFADAEESIIEYDDINKAAHEDSTDDIIGKLDSLSLGKSDSAASRNKQDQDDDYRLTNISNKIPSIYLHQLASNDHYKLFIFGDSPSKLDRAVYLAIQNTDLNEAKYPYLKKWLHFMRSFKQSDMQKWSTPTRSNVITRFSKNFNM